MTLLIVSPLVFPVTLLDKISDLFLLIAVSSFTLNLWLRIGLISLHLSKPCTIQLAQEMLIVPAASYIINYFIRSSVLECSIPVMPLPKLNPIS